jgi:hypothetical protein
MCPVLPYDDALALLVDDSLPAACRAPHHKKRRLIVAIGNADLVLHADESKQKTAQHEKLSLCGSLSWRGSRTT